LTQKTEELQDIMSELETLQSRVKAMDDDTGPVETPTVPETRPLAPHAPLPRVAAGGPQLDADLMALLKGGVADLTGFTKLKQFPAWFSGFSERTGLRMLLLKRWTSGLQVFMETNIKTPGEAKRKRSDGRAPIPSGRNDIFQSVGEEATVYCGPVPTKHFPLDLTLMLGRGSRDRKIVLLPLPSQNHWNTFVYLDADQASEGALDVAEILAHFALARMCMLNKGIRSRTGRVESILKTEMARRAKAGPASPKPALPAPGPDEEPAGDLEFVTPVPDAGPGPSAVQPYHPDMDVDPFQVSEPGRADGPDPIPLAPKAARPEPEATAADLPADDEVPAEDKFTPEGILHHSGELPALPKAACHIMAVIEDPKTTATRLEKALAMDQALTAKVLRIANSPFYGAVREIRTVSEAIVRLGFVTIRNWTLVTATKSVFLAPGAGTLYKKIWHQSVMSAMAGQLVGQTLRAPEPESLFIGGLMQNIGQLVLARSHPELFQQILTEAEHSGRPYYEVERQLLGFDHGELGALLIKEWNLSRDLEEAVRWHHRFDHPEAVNARAGAMISLGEEIAYCSGVGLESDGQEAQSRLADDELLPLSAAARQLDISRTMFENLVQQASQLHIDPHFFS